MAGISKAYDMLTKLPRVHLGNLRPLYPNKKKRMRLGKNGGTCGRGNDGLGHKSKLPPIGFEGGATPFHILIPKEPYYKGTHMKREYPKISLFELQRLIDTGWLDTSKAIDLSSLCNTKRISIDPHLKHYGIHLTDEGADIFKGKIEIEVQWANEMSIACIERNGGSLTTRFYDLQCVEAMVDPLNFFKRGLPIPRCKLPPQDLVKYYTNPLNRGYLSDPALLASARLELSQKYGYSLQDSKPLSPSRKDPRQIWSGLEPGWLVNLVDKTILKPTDETLLEYYKS